MKTIQKSVQRSVLLLGVLAAFHSDQAAWAGKGDNPWDLGVRASCSNADGLVGTLLIVGALCEIFTPNSPPPPVGSCDEQREDCFTACYQQFPYGSQYSQLVACVQGCIDAHAGCMVIQNQIDAELEEVLGGL